MGMPAENQVCLFPIVPDISRLMVGRDVILDVKKDAAKPGEALVKVKDLVVVDENGKHAVDHVSFSLRKGEILGIAGVEGNGQTELVRAITGMGAYSHGAIEISGQDIKGYSVEKIRKLKLAHIPADRMTMGMAPHLSITENMIADKLGWKRFFKSGVRDKRAVKEYGEEMVKQYLIFCKSQDVAINSLSGGNIQKAIVAREFTAGADIIILNQPTRGVDVGAMEFIHKKILEMRDEKKSLILVSADLAELKALSDRIIVFHQGTIAGVLDDVPNTTEEELGLYMLGLKSDSEEKLKEA